jgi:3-hydroxyacyl-[acyl-carrier-protein] dehydratase
MTLKNNLYKISDINREQNACDIEFVADSIIYRAHFPEQPITPGVCIIQIATELLGELMGAEFELCAVQNAKFLVVINPLETSGVTYTFKKIAIDEESGTCKVSAIVTKGETTYTKLSIAYKKK